MPKTREKLYWVLIVAVILAIAAVLIFALRSCARPEEEAAPLVPVATPSPTPCVVVREVEKILEVEKTVNTEMLSEGLRDMGTLITGEYDFTEVINFSRVKKLLKTDISLGFTESSFLASYDGVVTAGVDFRDITVEKDEENGRVTVHIPAAEIQSVSVDPESFTLYAEKSGLGNPLSAADFNTSLSELERDARQKALERGLLERADSNAAEVVRNFAAGFIDRSVWTLDISTGERAEKGAEK